MLTAIVKLSCLHECTKDKQIEEESVDTAQTQHTQAAEKTETLPNAKKTHNEKKVKKGKETRQKCWINDKQKKWEVNKETRGCEKSRKAV